MSNMITVAENGIHLLIEVDDERRVRLLHFSAIPFKRSDLPEKAPMDMFRLLELHLSGESLKNHQGSRYLGTSPGGSLRYVEHRDYHTPLGRKLEVVQEADGVRAISHLQLFEGIPVLRATTEIINIGQAPIGIEYVSSLALAGLAKEGLQSWDQKSRLHIPHNSWCGELQWRYCSFPEAGVRNVGSRSVKPVACSSTGTKSTSHYLPMGCYENLECGTVLFWQIEHCGSWAWEISMYEGQVRVLASGPTEVESHFWKQLSAGEHFVTVAVAFGSVSGGVQEAMQALTRYRRILRRPHPDNRRLPVIFNDYMNCLEGDPTTGKLLPLIDAAAEVGCEYFCIDAGWYADGRWWDGVGEWLPSRNRFPGGIEKPLEYIRSKGMVPGLWLELEVMGIKCPRAARVPPSWFFRMHGRPLIIRDRYQLDFRNPEVVAHADSVVDRLVGQYGVGYIKMDYNINAGIGTDWEADSAGDGLLAHNRAYLAWLERVMARYPELVMENCGSGGTRMDYALLRLHSIQSTSDQRDYRLTAVIAAASPTAVTPEQAAVWTYPLLAGDAEECVFNMVNALLLRVHLSGPLAGLSADRRALVREGIEYYKRIRSSIPESLPFWPLGLPGFSDQWVSLGLKIGNRCLLAVWRRDSPEAECRLPITHARGRSLVIRCAYPTDHRCRWVWEQETGILSVWLPQKYCARIFELQIT